MAPAIQPLIHQEVLFLLFGHASSYHNACRHSPRTAFSWYMTPDRALDQQKPPLVMGKAIEQLLNEVKAKSKEDESNF